MWRFLFIFAALVGGGCLEAQTAATDLRVTTDLAYTGKYVFRGQQLSGNSLQPSVSLAAGSSYASIWMNQSFNNEAGEIDFNGGRSFPLYNSWSFDAGATLYYATQASPDSRSETLEGYLGLNGSIGGTSIGLYAFRDINLFVTTFEGSAAYNLPWNSWATLRLSAAIGDSAPDHGQGYAYGSASVTVVAKVSDTTMLTLGANGSATRHLTGGEQSLFWLTAGLSVAF